MYLVLSTFAGLWIDSYHETISIGGLNYVSCGVGFFAGSRFNAFFQDRVYRRLKARNGGVAKPEFRIPLMAPGSILVPIGIFIYAWTAEYTIFWLWPNIGIFIVSAGMIVCFQSMQVYVVETYSRYAASAVAATVVLRSLAGFLFPLFVSRPGFITLTRWTKISNDFLTLYRHPECTLYLATDGEIQSSDLLAALSVGLLWLSFGNMENGSVIEVLSQLEVINIEYFMSILMENPCQGANSMFILTILIKMHYGYRLMIT